MATYQLNTDAVARTKERIEAKQYVLDSTWNEVQPDAERQNGYLDKHSWDEYAAWHLGLNQDATDETKGRYAFAVGDFSRVHRSALLACVYRAAEWHHKSVESAAYELLQLLDATAGIGQEDS